MGVIGALFSKRQADKAAKERKKAIEAERKRAEAARTQAQQASKVDPEAQKVSLATGTAEQQRRRRMLSSRAGARTGAGLVSPLGTTGAQTTGGGRRLLG